MCTEKTIDETRRRDDYFSFLAEHSSIRGAQLAEVPKNTPDARINIFFFLSHIIAVIIIIGSNGNSSPWTNTIYMSDAVSAVGNILSLPSDTFDQ